MAYALILDIERPANSLRRNPLTGIAMKINLKCKYTNK